MGPSSSARPARLRNLAFKEGLVAATEVTRARGRVCPTRELPGRFCAGIYGLDAAKTAKALGSSYVAAVVATLVAAFLIVGALIIGVLLFPPHLFAF